MRRSPRRLPALDTEFREMNNLEQVLTWIGRAVLVVLVVGLSVLLAPLFALVVVGQRNFSGNID